MTAPRWTQADISYLADPHVQAIGRTIIASSGILHSNRPCQAEQVWDRINRDWPRIDAAAMRVDPYDQDDIDGYVVDNRWQPGRGLAAAIAVSIGFWTLVAVVAVVFG
jgi:hypothetical protein